MLVRGIAAAKAKDKEEARFYLNWALRREPTPDQRADAWLWLSEVSDDPAEQRGYLEQILAENMAHPQARRKLAVLDGRLNPADIVDPDRLAPAPAAPGGPAAARRFVCPTCGGRMTYSPDGAALICEYCESRQAAGQPGAFDEQDFVVALATARGHRPPEAARWLKCRACNAEFVLAPATLSVTCPYCESAYVVETAETRELIPPTAVLPFAVTHDQARYAAAQWLARHADEGPPRAIHGLYLPAWTFDLQLEIRWTRVVRDEYRTRTETGTEARFFDDLLVPGRRSLPRPLAETVPHYPLADLRPYDASYLADWPAEVYSVAVGDASLDARSRALDEARAQVRALLADGSADLKLTPANLYVTSYKLVLLPIWVAHYTVEGRAYTVAVNGHTGKARGERPPSGARKVWNWLLGEDD